MINYEKIKDFGRRHAKQAILTFSALAAGAGLIGTHNHYHPNNEIDRSNIERTDIAIDSTHTEQPDLYDLTHEVSDSLVSDSLEHRLAQDTTQVPPNTNEDGIDYFLPDTTSTRTDFISPNPEDTTRTERNLEDFLPYDLPEITSSQTNNQEITNIKGTIADSRQHPLEYLPAIEQEDEAVTTTEDKEFYLWAGSEYKKGEDLHVNSTLDGNPYVNIDNYFIEVGKEIRFITGQGVEFDGNGFKIDLETYLANPEKNKKIYPYVTDSEGNITESVEMTLSIDEALLNPTRNANDRPSQDYETESNDSSNYSPTTTPDTTIPGTIMDLDEIRLDYEPNPTENEESSPDYEAILENIPTEQNDTNPAGIINTTSEDYQTNADDSNSSHYSPLQANNMPSAEDAMATLDINEYKDLERLATGHYTTETGGDVMLTLAAAYSNGAESVDINKVTTETGLQTTSIVYGDYSALLNPDPLRAAVQDADTNEDQIITTNEANVLYDKVIEHIYESSNSSSPFNQDEYNFETYLTDDKNEESISTSEYPSEIYDPISSTNFAFEGLNNQPLIGTLYERSEQERPIEKFSQSVVGNYALNCTEDGFEYENKEPESPTDHEEVYNILLEKSGEYRLSNLNDGPSQNLYDNIETSIENICENHESNHTLPQEQIESVYDSITTPENEETNSSSYLPPATRPDTDDNANRIDLNKLYTPNTHNHNQTNENRIDLNKLYT